MKKLLENVGEIHTPKINPNFRRIATPPPEPFNFFDDFNLIEDQLLFSTTNAFNDKDAGTFDTFLNKKFSFISLIILVIVSYFFLFLLFFFLRQPIHR